MHDQVAYSRARTGVAFPGQVTELRRIRDGLDAHAGHPLVAELFARLGVTRAADIDLSTTRVAQPCTYAAGLVNALVATGGPEHVSVALGHSLGEITALAFAGVLDHHDGLDLAFSLGQVGHVQHESRATVLVVLAGLEESVIEWHCRRAVAETGGVLEPSGYNGPRQLVYSGDRKAAEVAATAVSEDSGFARLLEIQGAYHASLMVEVLPDWRRAVESLTFRDPVVPVLSTVDCSWRESAAELQELLVRWLLLPVRWADAVGVAAAHGVPRLWDAGPGQVLAGMARRGSVLGFLPSFAPSPDGVPS
jgi:[acyl-carrier-protein] S-malonyltransferase